MAIDDFPTFDSTFDRAASDPLDTRAADFDVSGCLLEYRVIRIPCLTADRGAKCEGIAKSTNLINARNGAGMIPLYHESQFTFRFGDDRIIPRFHLEGVEVGRRISIFKIDPGTDERLGLLATAIVGSGGWVDLQEPIVVKAGDAFVAMPASESTPGDESKQSSGVG